MDDASFIPYIFDARVFFSLQTMLKKLEILYNQPTFIYWVILVVHSVIVKIELYHVMLKT